MYVCTWVDGETWGSVELALGIGKFGLSTYDDMGPVLDKRIHVDLWIRSSSEQHAREAWYRLDERLGDRVDLPGQLAGGGHDDSADLVAMEGVL